MAFHDITRAFDGDMMVYPGDPAISVKQKEEKGCRVSALSLSTHSGTHLDAPSHYISSGITVDRIPFETLMGEARVIDLSANFGSIGRYDLEGKVKGAKRVLLKTSFSGKRSFTDNYPHLTNEAAEYLLNEGVIFIGIDTPSIESFGGNGSVHTRLLSNNVICAELLDLSFVTAGVYNMIALPLRLKGLDGAPARIILSDIAESERGSVGSEKEKI